MKDIQNAILVFFRDTKSVVHCIFVLLVCGLFMGTVHAEIFLVKDHIEMQCGSHVVEIKCGKAKSEDPVNDSDVRICVHNTLSFTDLSSKEGIPNEPKEVVSLGDKGNTPSDMTCGEDKNGFFYAMVLFLGCNGGSTCEQIELFTEAGRRLTINGATLKKIVRKNQIKFSPKWQTIEVPDTSLAK